MDKFWMDKFWILGLALMLALATTVAVHAQTDDNNTAAQALNVRYDNLACKVNFTDKQIDLLIGYAPEMMNSTNLSSDKGTLNDDLAGLKVFVDDTNKTGFDNYVNSPFRQDLQKATLDLTSIKKNFKKYNVSNDTKVAFVNDLKTLNQQYADCVNDKEIKMGKVMQTHLENWDKYWTDIISKMSKNGINTTEMENLKADIEAKNLQLQALLQTQNITQLKTYIGNYRQDSMHYAARFETERLKGYKGRLEGEATKYNMTTLIADIDSKIATANNYTQPGHKYNEGEFKNVWNNIQGANKDMKELSQGVLNERKQELKDMKLRGNNRTTARPNMPSRGVGK